MWMRNLFDMSPPFNLMFPKVRENFIWFVKIGYCDQPVFALLKGVLNRVLVLCGG